MMTAAGFRHVSRAVPDTPLHPDAPAGRPPEHPSEGPALTHFDAAGRAQMVDVAAKPATHRVARATGSIRMEGATLALVAAGRASKGDVIGVARIAAIQAAKRTAELIPLCHPLPLTGVEVTLEPVADGVRCRATARTVGRTGVEMEALTAVMAALLTVYDMLKAVDRGMEIGEVRLVEKRGGRSGAWARGPG